MPAKSKQQQKFMGLVHAYKKGEVPASKVSKSVKDAAKSMSNKSVKKYAKTKHDELPKKVAEAKYKGYDYKRQNRKDGLSLIVPALRKTFSNMKDLKKYIDKHGTMESVTEKKERDYKAEYKKFQSSTKAKKYRAELNKYNRQKGTYGNGDGKDASHKGGKIVGFEAQSKNRGRREKSRLKKESAVNEQQYFDPKGKLKKYMDKVLKQAGIRVITYDPMKQSFYNGTWGGFYTVASSNKVDMPGHGKVKRSSAVLPVYIDKKGEVELGVSGDGFKLGRVNSSQVLKNLKDFKKSDLEESINERAWTPAQEKAVKELDKKFYKLIGKKGIEPYTYEASQMWTSGGFRKEMRKIFGKDVKESVNEMKVYSKSQGMKKIKSMKKTGGAKIYKVDKVKTKIGGKNVTMYNLHTRNQNHTSNQNPYGLDMAKGVYLIPIEEGTCGYGLDGNLGEEPAGPHLLKRIQKIRKKKKDVNEMTKSQAAETLKQLGGNKFIVMTGAKRFLFSDKGLGFKIGRNAKAVNYVHISLNGKDLYDMKFQKGTRVLKKVNDVYGDQLQKMFTKYTGMYTSLGTMGR